MPKVKTAFLTPRQIDWAVAQIENALWVKYDNALENDQPMPPRPSEFLRDYEYGPEFAPSEDRAQGVPIIERKDIHTRRGNDLHFPKGNEKGDFIEPLWLASIGDGYVFHGQTILIAALRCFVASELGDEIEIPQELA